MTSHDNREGSVRDFYAPIENEIHEVEEIIVHELTRNDPFLDEIVRYGFKLSGKRLRPALLLLCGKTIGDGKLRIDHLRSAAAVEMIHTGTLIHDDILDGAFLRRHLETMNLRWDSEVSVLAGDVLFMRALKLMTLSEDLSAYRELAEASHRTCEGELMQIGTRSDFELSEKKFIDIIKEKTGALIESSCALGVHFSGADVETMNRFRIYGSSLGTAFQITDDVLDLIGIEDTSGKTLGTDFANRKPTIPLIHFLATAPQTEREQMNALIDRFETMENALSDILTLLRSNGSIEYAISTARLYAEKAKEAISPYSGRETYRSLLGIADTVAEKRFE